MSGPAKQANGTSRRLAWAVGASAFLFLLLGGEYNTLDWIKIRRLEREEQARVAELQQTVDSLTKVAQGAAEGPAGAGTGGARELRHDPEGGAPLPVAPG